MAMIGAEQQATTQNLPMTEPAAAGVMALNKPMKAVQAMKAMRNAKKKRVSKVAKGRFAKRLVFNGKKEKTVSGLTKDDIVRNKAGKLVSRKKSALGKKFDRVKGWRESFMKARAVMGVRGFVAMNGQTAQGKALYAKTRSFYSP